MWLLNFNFFCAINEQQGKNFHFSAQYGKYFTLNSYSLLVLHCCAGWENSDVAFFHPHNFFASFLLYFSGMAREQNFMKRHRYLVSIAVWNFPIGSTSCVFLPEWKNNEIFTLILLLREILNSPIYGIFHSRNYLTSELEDYPCAKVFQKDLPEMIKREKKDYYLPSWSSHMIIGNALWRIWGFLTMKAIILPDDPPSSTIFPFP